MIAIYLPPDLKLAHDRLFELQTLAPVDCEVVIYGCSKYVGLDAIYKPSTPTQTRLHSIPSFLRSFSLFLFLFSSSSSSSSYSYSYSPLPFLFLFSPHFLTLFFFFEILLAPSQKPIILHTNLSTRLDSFNMSSQGQSMQKMEVMLLVRNSGIGNPRNLRRRSQKKPRRSRGNNVRTIAPKRRPEWLKREANSALELLLASANVDTCDFAHMQCVPCPFTLPNNCSQVPW